MSSLEKLANANIKNRAEFTQLSTELNRLEKEKQNEIRMFNNEIQRFKARYSKSNFSTDSPEASNVKMYETHNPGFCFKRNGEHRVQQVEEEPPTVDFVHLHFLLFTDGEVDIEKILCLHLLSSHETDHLTPPRRPRTITNFTRKDSPLEQLIERSKENNPKETVLKAILPTYVLDVNKGNPKRTLMDERLSARLLVNEKILELITTVISALEHSNPEKVQHLVSIAEDPSQLKKIFRKQHIQDFVMTLKDHSLNSCSSFILTQPSKLTANHLEIRTPSGALEDLIRYIRSNVLQFQRHESWSMLEIESKELVSIEHTPMKSSVSSSSPKSGNLLVKKESQKEPTIEEGPKFRRKSTNFVKKNIDLIPTYKPNVEEEIFEKPKRKRSSVDSKVITAQSKIEISTDPNRKDSRKSSIVSDTNREKNDHVKVHTKQTKCPACMEKWKVPLPEPKVPKFSTRLDLDAKRVKVERVGTNPVLKTDNRRRIMNLIEQEEYKLDSYDRKYSNVSGTSNQSKKRASTDRSSLDLVALNILDLEKIRYEIREKETKKKLEKFLKT